MPEGSYCPIGSLNLHTMNYERTECIWCGPNGLAWKPGVWKPIEDGQAWSVEEVTDEPLKPQEPRALDQG